jgi:hypothetical protein
MASIVDAGAMPMPPGKYNSSQSFKILQLYPRQLPTSVVAISLQTPPVGSATFVVEVSSTAAGTFREIARLAWPSGLSGSREVPLGIGSSSAWMQNNTSSWLRLSLTTTGPLTGSAWLSKPGGAVGIGADVHDVPTGAAALMTATPEARRSALSGATPRRRRA